MPSAWQQRVEPKEGEPQFDFDLAIVGGGVGGAYLVSRLHEEFVLKRGQAMPKIALFERSDKMGGRLMSGYGAGALNLGYPVLPFGETVLRTAAGCVTCR